MRRFLAVLLICVLLIPPVTASGTEYTNQNNFALIEEILTLFLAIFLNFIKEPYIIRAILKGTKILSIAPGERIWSKKEVLITFMRITPVI